MIAYGSHKNPLLDDLATLITRVTLALGSTADALFCTQNRVRKVDFLRRRSDADLNHLKIKREDIYRAAL